MWKTLKFFAVPTLRKKKWHRNKELTAVEFEPGTPGSEITELSTKPQGSWRVQVIEKAICLWFLFFYMVSFFNFFIGFFLFYILFALENSKPIRSCVLGSTVDPICFTQNFEHGCWPKTYGKKIWKKYENHGMVCPPPQNQKEDKNPSVSYHNHLHPFFEDFGGVSTSSMPSYEWSSWQLRTRRAASVRMFDHKRERCTVCSQCAPLPSTLHPFSLMKKVSFDRFQPFLFDFISWNNGSGKTRRSRILDLLVFCNKLVNVFSL